MLIIQNIYILIKVSCNSTYKGGIGKKDEFLVPTGLESGKEYLLFLIRTEDGNIDLGSLQ